MAKPTDPEAPEEPQPEEIRAERAALQKVRKVSFAANPTTVKTFDKTVFFWNVYIPSNSPIPIAVKLDGELVDSHGTKEFSLRLPKAFQLIAATEHAERLLDELTVNVDPSECQTEVIIPGETITLLFRGLVINIFQGNSDVEIKPPEGIFLSNNANAVKVAILGQTISIFLPLEIKIPHWFNARVDISVELEILSAATNFDTETKKWKGDAVNIMLRNLDINASWTLEEHLFSLGCTAFVQSAMEKMAEGFLTHILIEEVIRPLRRTCTDKVKEHLDELHKKDPQRRIFAPFGVMLTPEGLHLTACPV